MKCTAAWAIAGGGDCKDGMTSATGASVDCKFCEVTQPDIQDGKVCVSKATNCGDLPNDAPTPEPASKPSSNNEDTAYACGDVKMDLKGIEKICGDCVAIVGEDRYPTCTAFCTGLGLVCDKVEEDGDDDSCTPDEEEGKDFTCDVEPDGGETDYICHCKQGAADQFPSSADTACLSAAQKKDGNKMTFDSALCKAADSCHMCTIEEDVPASLKIAFPADEYSEDFCVSTKTSCSALAKDLDSSANVAGVASASLVSLVVAAFLL